MSWKPHFSRFLAAPRLHFAAHSHHPWPDVSFAAQQQAWLDAARLADDKWDEVFERLLPAAQAHIARQLRLPDPRSIGFAPNTHELLMRLWSSLEAPRPRVLTTASEFHSFERQMRRLEEAGAAEVERVRVEPVATFAERFIAKARQTPPDLIYLSHVFYDSGAWLRDLDAVVDLLPREPLLVIDGYHAFMAVPVDLSRVAGRVFYLAGGYKYAMAGEGCCFLHAPPDRALRPRNTGWLAAFGELAAHRSGEVPYSAGGLRFLGGTFDPTPFYRFNAVQDWLGREQITVAAIRAHVVALQQQLLEACERDGLLAGAETLPGAATRGNFIAWRHPQAAAWQRALRARQVVSDCRGDRLRIGFGAYHDAGDVAALADHLAALPARAGRGNAAPQ